MLTMLLFSHIRFAREVVLPGELTTLFCLSKMKYGYCLEVTYKRCRYIFDVLTRKQSDGRNHPQPGRRYLPRFEGDR